MPTLTIALIADTFFDGQGEARLVRHLREARSRGAELAVLPELPLNPWSPASKSSRDEDAEPPAGPRHQALSNAARAADLAVIGGAIVQDPLSGRRNNIAIVFDRMGALVSSYRKVHLPEENGFWEAHHYEPGDALAAVIEAFPMRLGIQICSDINRPDGSQLLAALGAEAIINPRASEAATFHRWKAVFIATAITGSAYVLSVARPREEFGVPLGGPSIAVAPTGDVLLETTEALSLVTLDRNEVARARGQYPGYLAMRADLYAEGWSRVKATRLPHQQPSAQA